MSAARPRPVCVPLNSQQWVEGTEYRFPSLVAAAAVGEWQERGDVFLSFKTPQLGEVRDVGKKAAYYTCVKVSHLRSLAVMGASRWTELFGQDHGPKGCWRSLYKPPIEKRADDLQWRIVHGAIATMRHRTHLDPSIGEGCLFCLQTETVAHLFFQCPRLGGLLTLLGQWFQGLGEVFSHEIFVFGPRYSLQKSLYTR